MQMIERQKQDHESMLKGIASSQSERQKREHCHELKFLHRPVRGDKRGKTSLCRSHEGGYSN